MNQTKTPHSSWENPDLYLKRDLITICYRTYGDIKNPVIVMIMGLSASGTFWSPDLCQMIADKGFFVISADNRDTGKSTSYENWKGQTNIFLTYFKKILGMKVGAPYTIFDIADDYIFLIKSLDLEKAHFLGASYGGMIAQAIAFKEPAIVESLVLVNTPQGSYKDIIPGFKYLFTCLIKKIQIKKIGDPKQQAFIFFEWLLHFIDNSRHIRDIKEVSKLVKFNVNRACIQEAGARQSLAVIKSLPFDYALSDINIPTLVMSGNRDFVFGPKKSKNLAKKIVDSKLIIIKDMGHAVMPSLYKEFSYEVLSFLNSISFKDISHKKSKGVTL